MSICKKLSKSLSGTWTYESEGIWLCNDGLRYMTRNTPLGEPEETAKPQYWLRHFFFSGERKPPERAEKYFQPVAKIPPTI